MELLEVRILKYNLMMEEFFEEMHDSILISLLEGLLEGIFQLKPEYL